MLFAHTDLHRGMCQQEILDSTGTNAACRPFVEPGRCFTDCLPDLFSFAEVSTQATVSHLSTQQGTSKAHRFKGIQGDKSAGLFQPLGSLQEFEPQKYTTFSCESPSNHGTPRKTK